MTRLPLMPLATAVTAHLASLRTSGYAVTTHTRRRAQLAQWTLWCDAAAITTLAALAPTLAASGNVRAHRREARTKRPCLPIAGRDQRRRIAKTAPLGKIVDLRREQSDGQQLKRKKAATTYAARFASEHSKQVYFSPE